MNDPFQRGLNKAAAGLRRPKEPDLDTCTDAEAEAYGLEVEAYDHVDSVDDEGELLE